MNILLHRGTYCYAEVGGIIYCLTRTTRVCFRQNPADWFEQYPYWVWAILPVVEDEDADL